MGRDVRRHKRVQEQRENICTVSSVITEVVFVLLRLPVCPKQPRSKQTLLTLESLYSNKLSVELSYYLSIKEAFFFPCLLGRRRVV